MVRSSRSSIPRKKKEKNEKKGDLSHGQEPVKPTHSENTQKGTMRAMRSLHAGSGTEKSEVNLDSQIIIGVPDLLARRGKEAFYDRGSPYVF